MFWDEKIEGLSRDEMTYIQGEKLREMVKYAYARVNSYKRKFDEKGVHPEEIRTVEDVSSLPFTTKSDLRDIGFKMEVHIVGPLSIPRSEGKAKRVIDTRGKLP